MGLEFQYLMTENEECSYRLIAYRNDKPKTYSYKQTIDMITKELSCCWERINFKPKDKYI